MIDRHFAGHGSYALAVVVTSPRYTAGDPPFRRAVERTARVLDHEAAVASVRLPRRGTAISANGHVAVVRGGAGADTAEMVRAAGRVHDGLEGLAPAGVELAITGSPALWSQFNEENKAAMLRSILASVSAVMVVPSQPFRTSALGILLAVGFVLAASLTLLPAVLARLGPRIDSLALPWAGAVQHRTAYAPRRPDIGALRDLRVSRWRLSHTREARGGGCARGLAGQP